MYILKKEFQYTDANGVILTLKPGINIDNKDGSNYIIQYNRKSYKIPSNIIDNNPDFFERKDIKTLLLDHIKLNSKKTNIKKADALIDFIEDNIIQDNELVNINDLTIALQACKNQFQNTNDKMWLTPLHNLGWDVNENGNVYKT